MPARRPSAPRSQALKAGEIVGVFPEATISRAFELKDFKSGAVRMAQAADVPLIPMAIWGSQRVWTKGHPKRLGRTNIPITLSVGEPLRVTRKDNADAANPSCASGSRRCCTRPRTRYPPADAATS